MSDYTKSTNFATKDNLSSGNALKIVKGTEIDTEFNNIATAVATKADLANTTFTGTTTIATVAISAGTITGITDLTVADGGTGASTAANARTNLSTSDKEHPTFLQHAAKLHKAGATHLHMIAGSDRVDEYKTKLAQYNGKHKGALYNFKHITVHSAGERDPDAEGVSGMSASKMRGHAENGNFKEFKKGIPKHVAPEHAKELYHDVRKGMNLKEDMNYFFEQLLTEGVHDKAIFKAVFLSGGPGSGKDYVLDNTLAGHGLTEINSDKALEFLMEKRNLDKTMPASEKSLYAVGKYVLA